MNYVIIGNSAAGIGAVEGIRQMDKQGGITVIAEEPHHTYARPLISYLLQGKTDEQKMKYRDDEFYTKNGCRLLAGKTVAEIRPEEKQAVLGDGSLIPYDKLLVGTGASALIPPYDGLDTVPHKFTFMSLDDARRLNAALGTDKRVLIVGAGLIALKCAEGILAKTKNITIINRRRTDSPPRILSSILDAAGSSMVQRHLEAQGLRFKLGYNVSRFDGNRAILDDDTEIEFDILVLAIGVRPNTELLGGIADVDRGVLVNAKSETSARDIYAAGDCTQALDVSSGKNRVMAILPNAYMQGECAGVNMAGGSAEFDKAIPMNAIGLFGLSIITAGSYTGAVYSDSSPGNYKQLFYNDNKLNGYILIGNVEKAGIYTSLIRERTPLDSIDFALICEKPGLMAFTREARDQKLGGVGV